MTIEKCHSGHLSRCPDFLPSTDSARHNPTILAISPAILPESRISFKIMPGEETLQKHNDGSDSEGEESDVEETFAQIDIDPSKLTPLSPEVISKQVCLPSYTLMLHFLTRLSGYY